MIRKQRKRPYNSVLVLGAKGSAQHGVGRACTVKQVGLVGSKEGAGPGDSTSLVLLSSIRPDLCLEHTMSVDRRLEAIVLSHTLKPKNSDDKVGNRLFVFRFERK